MGFGSLRARFHFVGGVSMSRKISATERDGSLNRTSTIAGGKIPTMSRSQNAVDVIGGPNSAYAPNTTTSQTGTIALRLKNIDMVVTLPWFGRWRTRRAGGRRTDLDGCSVVVDTSLLQDGSDVHVDGACELHCATGLEMTDNSASHHVNILDWRASAAGG